MKIQGSQALPVDAGKAYELLQNPDVLASCMPGCEKLVKAGDDIYEMKMKMVLAAVSGQFDGKVRIADQDPPHGFKLVVEGNGRIGFMKGEGLLRIKHEDSGCTVNYDGDVHVGGTIAAVGQRLIDSTSKLMIRRFFDKLIERAGASA